MLKIAMTIPILVWLTFLVVTLLEGKDSGITSTVIDIADEGSLTI